MKQASMPRVVLLAPIAALLLGCSGGGSKGSNGAGARAASPGPAVVRTAAATGETQTVAVKPPPPPYAPPHVSTGTPIKTAVGQDLPLTITFDCPGVSGSKHDYNALIGSYGRGEGARGEASVDAHEETSPARSASMSLFRGFMYIVRPTRFPLGETRRTPAGQEIYRRVPAPAAAGTKAVSAPASPSFEGHMLWFNDGQIIRVFSIGTNAGNVYTLHFPEAAPNQQEVDLKQGYYVQGTWDAAHGVMVVSPQRRNDDPSNPQDVRDFLNYVRDSAARFGLPW